MPNLCWQQRSWKSATRLSPPNWGPVFQTWSFGTELMGRCVFTPKIPNLRVMSPAWSRNTELETIKAEGQSLSVSIKPIVFDFAFQFCSFPKHFLCVSFSSKSIGDSEKTKSTIIVEWSLAISNMAKSSQQTKQSKTLVKSFLTYMNWVLGLKTLFTMALQLNDVGGVWLKNETANGPSIFQWLNSHCHILIKLLLETLTWGFVYCFILG